ncbi:hypothetical protein [Streptomyces sp. NPDC049906]|uniref:hypothetical protein n=1 Tax=Streptomyces sp. NPDC049906 TaxID=3155656 RepID=UPI00343B1866
MTDPPKSSSVPAGGAATASAPGVTQAPAGPQAPGADPVGGQPRTAAGAAPQGPAPEARGCLFALSQPPLMIFLTVIGTLLMMGAVHDLFLLGR